MEQRAKPVEAGPSRPPFGVEAEEIAYLAKRHRISPVIIREIIRRVGSGERSAVEREIREGMMRR